jgi:hypothetical protein
MEDIVNEKNDKNEKVERNEKNPIENYYQIL